MQIKTNTTLGGGDAPAAPATVVDEPTAPVDVTPPSEPPSTEAPAEVEAKGYPDDEDPHIGWKRAELDAYATELGVENPEEEANKGDVLALIEGD